MTKATYPQGLHTLLFARTVSSVLFAFLTFCASGLAQVPGVALEETIRTNIAKKVYPSESPDYLRSAAPRAEKYAAVYARRLIRVSPLSAMKHANFESYLKTSLSSRRGSALEAETMAALRRHYAQVGGFHNRSIVLTALGKGDPSTFSGHHDPADIVDKPRRGGRAIRYQCKAGPAGTLRALLDPKYKDMYIVTTEDARQVVLKDILKQRSQVDRLLSDLESRTPERQAQIRRQDEKLRRLEWAVRTRLADRIPPSSVSSGGQPLPSERRITEVAKNALSHGYYSAQRSLGIAAASAPKTYMTRPARESFFFQFLGQKCPNHTHIKSRLPPAATGTIGIFPGSNTQVGPNWP